MNYIFIRIDGNIIFKLYEDGHTEKVHTLANEDGKTWKDVLDIHMQGRRGNCPMNTGSCPNHWKGR